MKTIKCPERAIKMSSTYGAWMSDASQLDDDRYWVAEHFSGDFNSNQMFTSLID